MQEKSNYPAREIEIASQVFDLIHTRIAGNNCQNPPNVAVPQRQTCVSDLHRPPPCKLAHMCLIIDYIYEAHPAHSSTLDSCANQLHGFRTSRLIMCNRGVHKSCASHLRPHVNKNLHYIVIFSSFLRNPSFLLLFQPKTRVSPQ